MKVLRSFAFFSLGLLITGCASLQVGSEFQSGRKALLTGNNEAALAYFQSTAQMDPTYIYGTAYRQGVWSYLGRAEYANGRLPQAQQTLEKALAANRQEDVARLYLGLTLARSGDRPRGLQEIEGGMRGIHDWLEWVTQTFRFSFGQFWDPAREIRRAIQTDLAMITGREFDWQRLIADGEWLGKQMEEEIDRARRDESNQLSRENDGGASKP
ncbi:MAG: tetratricopeptide repeat protein [Candidatus Binatia bacterium]